MKPIKFIPDPTYAITGLGTWDFTMPTEDEKITNALNQTTQARQNFSSSRANAKRTTNK